MSKKQPELLIVGIGADPAESALLQAFFSSLPTASGMAFVVVTPSPEQDQAAFIESIRACTPLPLQIVEDSAVIAVDQIYCAPPALSLVLREGLLQATTAPESALESLFQSLAQEQGEHAIGILLSRTGFGGGRGLEAIAAAGGLTLAPDSFGRQADSGLRESLASRFLDRLLAPEQMAKELLDYARQLNGASSRRDAQSTAIAKHLNKICDLLFESTQSDFKHYKTPLLISRIQRRMRVLKLDQIDRYVAQLRRDTNERRLLCKKLLIGTTTFFRDEKAFATLADQAMAELLTAKNTSEPIRVWVAGCATGEEAYTLAILFREQMAAMDNPPALQILATDIDEQALNTARAGCYPATIAEHVRPERLQRFFIEQDNGYQIVPEIREICFFSYHNLINDPPFTQIDLLSCRNLLIYLGPHLQKKLFAVFHYALRPGAYLFLGPAENIGTHKELFEVVSARHRLCRRTAAQLSTDDLSALLMPRSGRSQLSLPAADNEQLGQIAERILLDEFAPKYAVIDKTGKVLFLSAGIDKYLEYSTGSFSSHLIRLAREGLRAGLRAALDEANRTRRRVMTDSFSISTDQGIQPVMVTVQPMPELGAEKTLHMVIFQDLGLPRQADAGEPTPEGDTITVQLEQELQRTRLDLEQTVQALEAANEESKAANEELLMMNEELQSSNAALETAKEEIDHSHQALEQAYDDLENLLDTTEIATILLDRELNIRRFTPATRRLYNLIPSDIGRPLSDITHRLCEPPPLPKPHALEELTAPLRYEVQSSDGCWYIRQVSPYRTRAGRCEGMTVTFTDVTALRASEQRYRRQYAELETLYRTAPVGLALFDNELCFVRINERLAAINGLKPAEHIGRPLPELLPGIADAVAPILRQVLATGQPALDVEITGSTRKDPIATEIWLASYYPIKNVTGTVDAVSAVVQEITQRKHDEAVLHESARYKDEYLAMLAHELRNPLAPLRNSAEMLRMLKVADPRLNELMSIIDRQVNHMARMLDDLLDLSRISRGKMQIDQEKLDLVERVRQTAEDYRGGIEQKGLTLVLQLPAQPLWVQGDPTRLMQVLGNLLRNAIQYTEPGGEIKVTVAVADDEDAVWVRVSDTGIGLSAVTAEHLFEAFWQGDGTNRRGGLGLGLALVKGFVELHGGTVQVTSPGKNAGSVFHIRLPLLARPPQQPAAAAAVEAEPQALRILVVDDSQDTADTLRLLLEHEGHTVAVAYNGEQSLAMARKFQPDVALCDIGLPGAMDGYALARAFRADPVLQAVYLIAITGYGREQDRNNASAAGFDDHLLKPVSLAALDHALAKRSTT